MSRQIFKFACFSGINNFIIISILNSYRLKMKQIVQKVSVLLNYQGVYVNLLHFFMVVNSVMLIFG